MGSTIAVVILTYNEEENIKYALENIAGWANEIIVLDSYSTDNTVKIAEKYDASINFRKFDDFSSQRKYALTEIDISSDWIFVLDADEYLMEDLKNEIKTLLNSQKDLKDAYFIDRRFYWKGKWLKRGFYPTSLLRFGRKGMITCDDRPINEHLICLSKNIGHLESDFVDHNRKGLHDWVIKHNKYATSEARQLLTKDRTKYSFFKSQYERKRFIRSKIWNRLPPIIRPFLYFIYRYFLQLGFLDGKEGFMYHCIDSFIYRMLIDFKYLELKWEKYSEKKN